MIMTGMDLINSRKILTLILLITIFSHSYSQQSSIMYYMQGVPQSHFLNPATQPRCGFYLGLPGMSPLQINAENSAFNLNDVIWWDGDSTITAFHPDADFDKFLNNFQKVNYFSTEASTDILSYGFRTEGNKYHSFDITQRVISRVSYPKDLIRLYNGWNNGDEFDFSGMGINMLAFLEIATGVSHKVSDRFLFGYRIKVLFGEANIVSKKTDLTVDFGDEIVARSKFELNATIPGYEVPRDSSWEDGEFIWDDDNFRNHLGDISNAVFGNWGLGLDFGVHFMPVEKLTLSASILDLGFIRWQKYAYNMSQDAEFVFDGFDSNDDNDFFDQLSDSIDNTFKITNSQDPYATYLPAKVYLGVKYDLIDEISLSMLSRTEIYKGRLREQFNVTANFYPLKMIAASFNYAIMNNTYNNFGAGLALKAGPFNFYAISDNVPLVFAREVSSNVLIPHKAQTFNIRLGFNLVFGCKIKKNMRDLPLVI